VTPRTCVRCLAAFAILAATREVSAVTLGIEGTRFVVDGRPAFLLGFSYYGACGAPSESIARDLDDLRAAGFNWFRVWATWESYGSDVSAADARGAPREPYLQRLKDLLAAANRRGMIVDVTLSRGEGLPDQPAHLAAVATLVQELRPWRNWYLDLANERNIRDRRHVSYEELRELVGRAKQLDPQRLLTASHGGDLTRDDVEQYLRAAGVDFLAPHRPRQPDSPGQTAAKAREALGWSRDCGRAGPVHDQEPFRRDYGAWQPTAADFLADLRGAVAGGAAGWCFHNGSPGGPYQDRDRPRRSFDLRAEYGRLMDQLDPEEQEVVRRARDCLVP